MVQRYRPDELEMIGMHPESDGDYVDYADYIALERERDELQAKVIEQDDKLYKAEKRLEVACHVKADDKVGFDFAILDKMDNLFAILDKMDDLERKYYELIMAVETKCPNETRHETALRYIKNAESYHYGSGCQKGEEKG